MNEYITKEQKIKLEEELVHLSTVVRKEVLSEIEYAKSLGDLSENAEYHAAREKQGKLQDRILQIEHILKHAAVVEKKTDGSVSIGSVVTIKKQDTGEEKVYTVVSPEEADFGEGKISYKSPLGEALMAKKEGHTFSIQTPKGEQEYVVVEVQ
jgi:transcription elongation factor GreA